MADFLKMESIISEEYLKSLQAELTCRMQRRVTGKQAKSENDGLKSYVIVFCAISHWICHLSFTCTWGLTTIVLLRSKVYNLPYSNHTKYIKDDSTMKVFLFYFKFISF